MGVTYMIKPFRYDWKVLIEHKRDKDGNCIFCKGPCQYYEVIYQFNMIENEIAEFTRKKDAVLTPHQKYLLRQFAKCNEKK
jgi:hypothetical protein